MNTSPFTSFIKNKRQILFLVFLILCSAVFYVPHAEAVTGGGAAAAAAQAAADRGENFDIVGATVDLIASGVDAAIFKPLAELLYLISLTVGGVFIGIGGLALDLSISVLIVGMGGLFRGGFGQGVIELWVIIRDILNILFIFGFIYIGIKTILSSEDSGTRRSLGYLILAALLINFSLYITSAIIDFSNIAATQVYNEIANGVSGAVGVSDGQIGSVQLGANSISGAFLNAAAISSLFGGSGGTAGMETTQIISYAIFMLIFFIFAGFVFLIAAVRIIYRFVALSLYMIFSPMMFIGWILPRFASRSQEWWSGFLKNSFFAPAFLFLIYISLLLMQRLKTQLLEGPGDYTTLFKGGDMTIDNFTIFMFFGMMIGFLYASVKVGEMMGAAGAKSSLKMVGNLQGILYRNTVGKAVNKYGVGTIDALDRAAENGSKSAKFARTLVGGEQTRKALEKASNYGAGGQGKEDAEKDDKARTQRAARSNQIGKIGSAITAGVSAQGVDKASRTADHEKAIRDMERSVQNASSSQIVDMVKDKSDQKHIMSVAGQLSESQFKAIMDDKEIDDATKSAFGKARAQQIEKRLIEDTTGASDIGDAIGKADIADLKALGFETAITHAGKLSAKQIEDWKDLTPSEKTQIKAARKKELEVEFGIDAQGNTTGSGATELFKRIKNDDERSKLPDSILTHPAAAALINTNVLSKIVDNGGITDVHRAEIKKNVLDYYSVVNPDPTKLALYKNWFTNNNLGQRY